MFDNLTARAARLIAPAFAVLVALALTPASAAEPIQIGFGMALTGGLAANGKSALVAMQIWEADVNAKGGLLGRPVKLVFYDDQSNPSTVPGIYTKLLDVDKVELVVGGYATTCWCRPCRWSCSTTRSSSGSWASGSTRPSTIQSISR